MKPGLRRAFSDPATLRQRFYFLRSRLIACILWPLINSFDVSAGEIKTALGKRLAVCRSLILVRTASSCFTENAAREVWGAQ
jgi:hypothetical protein